MTTSAGWDLRTNLKFLTTPIMKIWEAVQNVQIGVVWVAQGSLKVIGNVTIRKSACNFLFDFNWNCASILYRFWDMASYFSKVAILTPLTCSWCCRRGLPRSNFAKIFGMKTRLSGLSSGVVCLIKFTRFGRTPTCDRQTDRQTQAHSIYRASIGSRSKN